MEFYYLDANKLDVKKHFLRRIFSKKTSKKMVEKKIVNPLLSTNLTLFHFHEIGEGLFHIALMKKDKSDFLNCFYDGNKHIFFFEKDGIWLHEIQQTSLWGKLSMIDPLSSNQPLFTNEDILSLLGQEKDR